MTLNKNDEKELRRKWVADFAYQAFFIASAGILGRTINHGLSNNMIESGSTFWKKVGKTLKEEVLSVNILELSFMILGTVFSSKLHQNRNRIDEINNKRKDHDHSKCLAEQIPIAPKRDYSKEWTKQINKQPPEQEIESYFLR